MKIIATLFFPGDPAALMAPEYEAKVEGHEGDQTPYGLGTTPERAIANLKEWFCPCDCVPDAACIGADQCQHTWEDA